MYGLGQYTFRFKIFATPPPPQMNNIKILCVSFSVDHASFCAANLCDDSKLQWVCCQVCMAWHHQVCVGLSDVTITQDDEYICSNCRELVIKTTLYK